MYLLTTKLRVYNSIELISNDDTDIRPLYLGAVKPDVGVDHNDVAQVENSAGVETCSYYTSTLSRPYSPGSPGH